MTLGLVDGNFVMPVSQVATTLAVGVLIGVTLSRATGPPEVSLYSALTSFLAVAGTGIVIIFAMTSLRDQPRSIDFPALSSHAWFVPRFWEQGNLL